MYLSKFIYVLVLYIHIKIQKKTLNCLINKYVNYKLDTRGYYLSILILIEDTFWYVI